MHAYSCLVSHPTKHEAQRGFWRSFCVASLQEQSILQGCLFLGGCLGTSVSGVKQENKSRNRTGKSISRGHLSEQRVTEPILIALQ